MLRKYAILLDPAAIESGGGSTVVTAPNATAAEPKGTTTQEPPATREPTKEELDTTFSVEDFETQQLEPHKASEPSKTAKKEEVKQEPVVEKKAETPPAKKEEPAKGLNKFLKPPVDKKVTEAAKTLAAAKRVEVPGTQGNRDYTGLKDTEVAVLKQMSNPAYEFTRNLIKENSELKKLEGTTYYQHEQAYLLDPSYQEARNVVSYAAREAAYWKQQLVLMSKGAEWQPVSGIDANGNFVPDGPKRQPTAEDAEEVRQMLSRVNNIMTQKQNELAEYPTKYKSRVTEDLRGIDSECKQRFSWEADPKLQDHLLTVQYADGPKDVPIKSIIQEFTSLFPPYMRNHPAVRVAANMNVAMIIGQAMLAEAQSGAAVEQTIEGEQTRVEPSTTARPAGEGKTLKEVNGVKEFTLAELPT